MANMAATCQPHVRPTKPQQALARSSTGSPRGGGSAIPSSWRPRQGVKPLAAQAAPQPRPLRGISASASSAGTSAAPAQEPQEQPLPAAVPLGRSGLEVPALGIGAWAWGDKFFWNDGTWDAAAEARARAAYGAAVAGGLGLVDTAEVYGTKQFGAEDSETLLGRFLAEGAGEVLASGSSEGRALVATKFAALPWRLGRGAVVEALRGSLARLGVPKVDLYQIHWPGVWGNEGFVDGLGDCVELGLARAVGVSNFNEGRLRRAHAQLAARGIPLASNQVHYNILYRVPEENGVLEACRELGVSVVAYCPLAQGMLTGKYSPANPPTGPRGASYSKEFLALSQPLLQRMREIGASYGGRSLTQVALNWLLSQSQGAEGAAEGFSIVPIPGAKTAAQVEEFAGALGWRMSAAEVQELRELGRKVPKIQGFPTESF